MIKYLCLQQKSIITKLIRMTDTILESLLTKFRQRSEVGQKKYNTTLDRKDLTLIEWLNHAQEEAMDLCLYLEKIKQTIKNNNDEREI